MFMMASVAIFDAPSIAFLSLSCEFLIMRPSKYIPPNTYKNENINRRILFISIKGSNNNRRTIGIVTRDTKVIFHENTIAIMTPISNVDIP